MKHMQIVLFISVLAFSSVLGGHIWVEDPVLEFQNARDLDNIKRGTIWITFMLQSGLGPDDYIKITFPEIYLQMNALIYSSQKTLLNTNLLKDAANKDQIYGPPATSTIQPYYWTFGVALAPNTWYKLQLTFFNNILQTSGGIQTFYNNPWTIATVSSYSDPDFIYYDENLSAGLIARAAPPVKFKNVNVTQSTPLYNSLLEAANDIYIDIDSTYAYDNGAFFEVTMNNNDFSFKTSCTNMFVSCPYPSTTTCYNLTAVPSYVCNLQKVESTDTSTRQLLFEHKGPIVVGQGFRIKTTVQNPFYYTNTVGGVYVRSYSRQAKLWYEEALVLSKFSVQQIVITDKLITYFWGLEGRAYNTTYRCPVGIYVTPTSGTAIASKSYFQNFISQASNGNIANEFIVNKVRVYFQITSQDFPAGRNYQMTVSINSNSASNMIYVDSSYSTNMPLVSGKRIMCKSETTLMQINCKNIGDAKAGSIYWFGVMFILLPNSLPAPGFGTVTFKVDSTASGVYNSLAVSQNSAGITPVFLSDSQVGGVGSQTYNDLLNNYRVIDSANRAVGYGQAYGGPAYSASMAYNKVVSIASDTALTYNNNPPAGNDFSLNYGVTPSAFATLLLPATGASGVVYSSTTAFKLILLIEAAPELLCGINGSGPQVNTAIQTIGCSASQTGAAYMAIDLTAADTYAAHTVFKCIFNVAMLSTYDSTQMQKGLQTFGGFWAGTNQDTACDYATQDTETYCAVYPYDSYSLHNKTAQDTNKQWNYIEQIIPGVSNGVTLTSFGEATLSCNSVFPSGGAASAQQYCSAVGFYSDSQGGIDSKSPAIIFRNVKFATSFTGNPLYPNEKVFDFIICFRFVNPLNGAASANTLSNPGSAYIYGTQEGTLASYGIFQSTVVWVPQATTYFKVGFVNFFIQNDRSVGNNGAVMPSLLRFGGRFNSSDFVACDALGIFLDTQGVTFGNSDLTTDITPGYTNNIGCGAISASILCSYFTITGSGVSTFNAISAGNSIIVNDIANVNNAQYIHFNQFVAFKGVYTGVDEFNHFIPVLPTYDTATFTQYFPLVAMIGQFKETTTAGMYDTLKHFIRFSPYKFSQGYTDVTVSNFPIMKESAGNVQSALGDGAGNIEINESGTAGICSASGPAANSGTSGFVNYLDDILPAKVVNSTTGLQIDAGLGGSSCPEIQANNEFSSTGDNDAANIPGNGWGAAFSVSSQAMDPFPDATNFTWPYSQASGYPSNKCLKYSYLYYDLISVYTRIYMITCPIDRWLDVTGATISTNQPSIALDQNDQFTNANSIANLQAINSPSVFTTSKGWKLTLQPFTGPWNWGKDFDVNNVMSYSWSTKYGNLAYFRSPSQVNPWTGINQQVLCSIGAVQSGWNRNGNAQMISITTTLKTVSIQLNYRTNQNVFTITEDFSTATASNDLISNYCTVQGIVNTCSVVQSANSFVFTITVSLIYLGTQTMTVSAGTPFIINYWVNAKDQDPTVSIQHGAYFKGWNPMQGTNQTGGLLTVNDCFTNLVGNSQRTDYTGSTTPLSQLLTVSAPYYMYQDGKQKSYEYTSLARGWFDLEWSVSRTVYKFTQFQIDLSWVGNAQSTYKANMHCVPHSNQKVNFEFATLGITTMTAIDLKPKMGQWTNQKFDYSMSNTQFSIRCFGGATPAAVPTTTQRPVVKWNIASTLITSGQTDDLSNQYTFTVAPDQLTSVVLNQKSWGARGAEASYTFKFTPSVLYNLGARLIFEFSRAIPGKFNRGGALECIQDGVPLYCFLVSERTVTMLINKKFDNSSNPNYGYNITLRGVAQPDTLDAFKKIFVAIDLDQDFSNGLNFATELSESAVDATTNLKLLPVLKYSQSVSETKVTYTLSANLKMTKTSVIEDQVLYAQFPGYDYARAFFHGFTPICTFVRQGDINAVNYAKNCTYVGHRKVKLYMALDAENQLNDLVYMITISAVPTPLVPTTGGYVVEFVLVDTSDFPISRSNMGHFNATPSSFDYNNLVRLQWSSIYLQVYNGVYNAIGNFTENDGFRFSKSFGYSFKGVNASSFRTYPNVLSGTAGNYWAAFFVGAETTTDPGYYQILFGTVEDMTVDIDMYAIIEPLDIEVQPYQCTIGYGTNFDIVAGGYSLPIIFDFKGCLPLSDVTLAGNVTDYLKITSSAPNITIKANPDFSVDFKFVPTINPMDTLTTIFIQFDHNSVSDPALQNAAKVHVNIAGTNKLSYKAISDITLNVVAAPSILPVITQLLADTYNGGVTLTFTCTLAGTMYWALSTDQADLLAKNYTDSSIFAQTIAQGFQQTIPDPRDRTFTKFGYTFISSANATISVKVNNVATLRDYSVVAVCSALSGQTSPQRYVNFTQYDNNGRGVVLFGNFSAVVPKANLAKFVCALASQFRLTNDRVWTQYGQICSNFRTRMLQANTTNTTGTSIVVAPNAQEYVYAFSILPDYFANGDTTYDEVKSAVTLSTFVSDVNAKLQPSSLGSATFNSVQQIRSKSSSRPGIPIFNSTTMNVIVTSTGGTVPFSLTNQTGFVFVVVGDAASTMPTIDQLKGGQTGSGANAVFADTEFIDYSSILTVSISGLTQCTQYQWWFAASELDPTLLGYNSAVFIGNNFTTIGCPTSFAKTLVSGFFVALFALVTFILA